MKKLELLGTKYFIDYDIRSSDTYGKQNMSFYQENYSFSSHNEEVASFNNRSMLGGETSPKQPRDDEYDPDFDSEVKNFLEELEEDIFHEGSDKALTDDKKPSDALVDSKKEQYEDYYDDFSDEDEFEYSPPWYDGIIQKKIKITKTRLTDLSKLVCYTSAVAREQIIRMEQDHNTPLCKLDYPRHPSISKDWTNYWRFNCTIKCKVDPPEPEHAHTQDCEWLLLEHVSSGTSTKTNFILPCEFPDYVMNAVEAFQLFINETSKDFSCIRNDEIPDSVYERPTWSYIKLRSNYKKELLLVACGKGLSPLIRRFKNWFDSGPGRVTNIVSVWCINIKWSQKKGNFPPSFIAGDLELRDKIGPVILKYSAKTNVNFNSIDVKLLAKTLLEFLCLTKETTVLDIGCNIGVLTLILAQKCAKAIGFNTLDHEVKLADEIKTYNQINNVTFLVCKPNEIQTKCLPFLIGCISVAVLHLAPPYGKSGDVMRALRNCPTIWRVAVYGTMSQEFQKYITILTSHDSGVNEMGEEFLPMRSCILDKFPIESAFDIVILFERKSLIEPKVELIANGPTVNLKSEYKPEYKITEEAKKNILKVEKGFGDIKPFRPYIPKVLRPCKKFGKFDSPLLPKDVKNENSFNKEAQKKGRTPSPDLIDEDDDSQPYVPLPVKLKMKEKGIIEPPTSSAYDQKVHFDQVLKRRAKRFDCPSSPSKKLHQVISSPPSKRSSQTDSSSPPRRTSTKESLSPPLRTSRRDCSSPYRRANRKDSLSPHRRSGRKDSSSPFRRTSRRESLSPLRRTSQRDSISPPRKISRRDTPSPCNMSSLTNYLTIKKEKCPNNLLIVENQKCLKRSSLVEKENVSVSVKREKKDQLNYPVKVEKDNTPRAVSGIRRKRLDIEREEGELSNESNDSNMSNSPLRVTIKNELSDHDESQENSTSIIDSVVIKSERESSNNLLMFQCFKIKQEPIDDSSDVLSVTEPVKVKSEPISYSPTNVTDFETMATPVHNPSSLTEGRSSPVSPTNFTVDGQSFIVNPNESFLTVKQEPQESLIDKPMAHQKPFVKIKLEKNHSDQQCNIKSSDSDDICIIQEEKKSSIKKERLSRFEDNGEESDLRKLLEKQRALQKQLAQSEFSVKREYSSSGEDLTCSSSSEQKYKPTFSPRTRIVSHTSFKNKIIYSRSPSPKYRSRSPHSNKYKDRSFYSQKYRTRSPVLTSKYRSRSPLSPRARTRKSRSPNTFVRRSRSPNLFRHKSRSPYSPSYRSRSPVLSKQESRSRSPYSLKDSSRIKLSYKHRVQSPANHGFRSNSRDSGNHARNNWSPNRYRWNKKSRSKSRSRSLSPSQVQRDKFTYFKRVSCGKSLSLSLSPSPPPNRPKFAYHEKKKNKKKDYNEDKKKKKSKTQENSKTVTTSEEKVSKTDGGSSSTKDDSWDIPGLSRLKCDSPQKSESIKLSPAKSSSSNSTNPPGVDDKEAI